MKTLDIQNYYKVANEQLFSISSIKATFQEQAEALHKMAESVNEIEYEKALACILATPGHVIICGMGKSGHVGKKIAATLASTGTPSFFLHPSEAFHGDLGMITKNDALILISNSGETDEVLQLIPSLKSFGNKIIAITGNSNSTLANHADATLELIMDKEVCPNNLAPTTSTTLTIAVGDALAVALMEIKRFEPNDFARFHPGGSLGKRLLTKVQDVMSSDNLPLVNIADPMSDVVIKMSDSRKGVAIVTDGQKLVGIITDGDLRRALTSESNFSLLKANQVMNSSPIICYQTEMLSDVEARMQENKVASLIVLNDKEQVVGLTQIYNL